MRIIGTIEHATCRIQVFQMSNKFSVKFELSMYEQTFKFRESPYLKDFNDMQRLIDAAFIGQVIAHFVWIVAARDSIAQPKDPIVIFAPALYSVVVEQNTKTPLWRVWRCSMEQQRYREYIVAG